MEDFGRGCHLQSSNFFQVPAVQFVGGGVCIMKSLSGWQGPDLIVPLDCRFSLHCGLALAVTGLSVFLFFFAKYAFQMHILSPQPSIIIFLLPQFVRKQCKFCHSPGRRDPRAALATETGRSLDDRLLSQPGTYQWAEVSGCSKFYGIPRQTASLSCFFWISGAICFELPVAETCKLLQQKAQGF